MNYDTLTIPDLKKHLLSYGLRTSGKKQELINRLNEYDTEQLNKRNEFNVFVKVNFSNYTINLVKGMNTTFLELKNIIFEKTGYSVDKQVLYACNGMKTKLLSNNDETLVDHGIFKESSFLMQPRLV